MFVESEMISLLKEIIISQEAHNEFLIQRIKELEEELVSVDRLMRGWKMIAKAVQQKN